MRQLDIIVPHYNEPWEICKPFFDMLALQRGVDFSDFRVILVNDGDQEDVYPIVARQKYPYTVDGIVMPHGGVSAARNRGIDHSDARWVMFCDCDDLFTSCYSLKCIMDGLRNPDFDLAWTPFYSETGAPGVVIKRDTFCHLMLHGKAFRRKTLLDLGLRFNERLDYAEDTAFVTMFLMDVPMAKVGEVKCGFVPYVWTHRPGSATTDPARACRNAVGLFRKNAFIAEEYRKRDETEPACAMAYRALCDAYVTMNRTDIDPGPSFEEEAMAFFGKWSGFANLAEDEVKGKAISGALNESILASPDALPKAEGFEAWYKAFRKRTKEAKGR